MKSRDRDRVSRWVSALRYALMNRIDPEELGAFIKREGGIDSCADKFHNLQNPDDELQASPTKSPRRSRRGALRHTSPRRKPQRHRSRRFRLQRGRTSRSRRRVHRGEPSENSRLATPPKITWTATFDEQLESIVKSQNPRRVRLRGRISTEGTLTLSKIRIIRKRPAIGRRDRRRRRARRKRR